MSANTGSDREGTMEPEPPGTPGGAARGRRRAGVQALIGLVACGAAIFLAWRAWWDQGHPLQAAARGLGSWDASRRADAVREIQAQGFGHGGESIRLLVPALKDADAGVRVAAAESLGRLASNAIGVGVDPEDVRAAAAALLERVGDPSPRVRAAVATSLGMIVTAAASPRPRGRNPTATRKAAAPAVDVDAVAAALGAVLDDPDARVREAAITGLGAMADKTPAGTRKGAEPPSANPGAPVATAGDAPPPGLLKALDDESAANRASAAAALAGYRRGLDPAIPTLLRHLDDDDPSVREAVAVALGRIRPSAVTGATVTALIARLKETGPGPAATRDVGPVARALGRLAPDTPASGEALAALTAALRDPRASTREAALAALPDFQAKAASALPAVLELKDKDPEPGVRQAAEAAIRKIKPASK